MSERKHDSCGAGCLWCAIRRAFEARGGEQIDGGHIAKATLADMLTDIDHLCAALGDCLAGILNDRERVDACFCASVWICKRLEESLIRNARNPLWAAMHAQQNGDAGPLQ